MKNKINIQEDYVSEEVGILIRDKGFPQVSDSGAECPTQALVIKWLRVKHNFHISVDADCKFEIERVKEGKYGGHIVIGETFWDTSSTEYDSCEAATEAAILYVIKNLLK